MAGISGNAINERSRSDGFEIAHFRKVAGQIENGGVWGYLQKKIDQILSYFNSNRYEARALLFDLASPDVDDATKLVAFTRLRDLADEGCKEKLSLKPSADNADAGARLVIGDEGDDPLEFFLRGADFKILAQKQNVENISEILDRFPSEIRSDVVRPLASLHVDTLDNRDRVLCFLDLREKAAPSHKESFDIQYDKDLNGRMTIGDLAEIPLSGVSISGVRSYFNGELNKICRAEVEKRHEVSDAAARGKSAGSEYATDLNDFLSRDDAPFPFRKVVSASGDIDAGKDPISLFDQIKKDIARGDYYVAGEQVTIPDEASRNDTVVQADALTQFCGMLKDIGCSKAQRNVILSTCHQELFALVMHATVARNGGPLQNNLAPLGGQDSFNILIEKGADGAIEVEAYVPFSPSLNDPIGAHLAGIMESPQATPWQTQSVRFTVDVKGAISVDDVQVRTLTVAPALYAAVPDDAIPV